MKKIIVYILTIAIAVTFVFALGVTTAFADDPNVAFSVTVDPHSVAPGGTVTATINITNNYPAAITGVSVNCNGSGISNIDSTIAANTPYGVQRPIVVTFASGTTSTALTFTLKYKDPTNADQTKTTATQVNQQSTIKVTATDTADSKTISAGDKVKFTFSITNSGNVPITNASLKAPPLNGGNAINSSAFNLNPGDVKQMIWTEAVNATIAVKPVLSFTADSTNKTLALTTLNITVNTVAQSSMTVALQADKSTISPGDSVVITATVTNTGTDKLTEIKLTDQAGNPISTQDTSLDANGSTTATATVNPPATGNYTYTATATNSKGTTVNATSQPLSITVASPSPSASGPAEAATATLKIDVAADTYSLASPGDVKFQVTVTNNSDVLLNNVQVTEKTLGDIGTISAMGKDSKTFEKTAPVDKTTQYVFTVTATQADGSTVTAVTDPLTVQVSGSSAGGLDTMTIILIIIVIAIAIVGLILFLLNRRNKRSGGGGGVFGGGAPAGGGSGGAYNARRRPSSFNNNTISKDVEPPKAVRKPIATTPAPRITEKKGNTKFGDRNKF